jgi:hypothetical protein
MHSQVQELAMKMGEAALIGLFPFSSALPSQH